MAATTDCSQFLFHNALNNSDFTVSDGRTTMDIIIIIIVMIIIIITVTIIILLHSILLC
jgi:hypothetical protein